MARMPSSPVLLLGIQSTPASSLSQHPFVTASDVGPRLLPVPAWRHVVTCRHAKPSSPCLPKIPSNGPTPFSGRRHQVECKVVMTRGLQGYALGYALGDASKSGYNPCSPIRGLSEDGVFSNSGTGRAVFKTVPDSLGQLCHSCRFKRTRVACGRMSKIQHPQTCRTGTFK